jgi:hypothetical protein
MTTNTFELDFKAYLPRMGRIRRKFDPDIAKWRAIKDAVRDDKPVDWHRIINYFRVGRLLCPESLRPASREAHKNLKGIYAFFQHGYIVRQGDSVALFSRIDGRQRISRGQSIFISSTPAAFQDHSGGIQKLESLIDATLKSVRPMPFAIGYSELQLQSRSKSPAYLWLLHEVPYRGKLSPSRQGRSSVDSFRGMKNLASLHNRRVRCDGGPVNIEGAFDRLLIEMLYRGHNSIQKPDAAIRFLTAKEIRTIPATEFKRRDEIVRKRLSSFGLIAAASSTAWIAKEAIDWAARGEWVGGNWDEIVKLLHDLERLGRAYF